MSKISVVVCAKDEEKYIENCLKALKVQLVPCEIIVVDGHSKDNTVNISRKYTNKIVFDSGRGISDARNTGWKEASCEVVAYCDSDSIPPPDWTKKILGLIDEKYCISGPVVSYDGKELSRIKMKMWGELLPRFMAFFGYHNVWGANMAFKRKILKSYRFRLRFLEDYEIGRRLNKTGKVLFCKDLKMPVSSRRFRKGFHRTCVKYYVREILMRKMGKTPTTGYFK